jgi:hypothetical protein
VRFVHRCNCNRALHCGLKASPTNCIRGCRIGLQSPPHVTTTRYGQPQAEIPRGIGVARRRPLNSTTSRSACRVYAHGRYPAMPARVSNSNAATAIELPAAVSSRSSIARRARTPRLRTAHRDGCIVRQSVRDRRRRGRRVTRHNPTRYFRIPGGTQCTAAIGQRQSVMCPILWLESGRWVL